MLLLRTDSVTNKISRCDVKYGHSCLSLRKFLPLSLLYQSWKEKRACLYLNFIGGGGTAERPSCFSLDKTRLHPHLSTQGNKQVRLTMRENQRNEGENMAMNYRSYPGRSSSAPNLLVASSKTNCNPGCELHVAWKLAVWIVCGHWGTFPYLNFWVRWFNPTNAMLIKIGNKICTGKLVWYSFTGNNYK